MSKPLSAHGRRNVNKVQGKAENRKVSAEDDIANVYRELEISAVPGDDGYGLYGRADQGA
jgi:hypothetical protein